MADQLRQDNITILSAVRELAGYLERHCLSETLRPSDLGRRGISGERKLRAILRAILKRFANDSDLAALAILSAACGSAIATKVEPKVERSAVYTRSVVTSALWSLVQTHPVQHTVDAGNGHVITSSYKPHRPHLAGRKLHEAVQTNIINKYVRWIVTEDSTKDILRKMLVHRYQKLDWWTWARNNHDEEWKKSRRKVRSKPNRRRKPLMKGVTTC